jgi:redox-sensing transcriptional repressor
MRYRKIPDETVCRLPIYMRGLRICQQKGKENVSSKRLSELIGINSSQIRKDLSFFGAFGTPGVGYNTEMLLDRIKGILMLDKTQKAALIGFGNLGAAVLEYARFGSYGFQISAVFDSDKKKIGKIVGNAVKVESMSSIGELKKRKICLAIVAVPAIVAQEIADRLIKAGVKGILNFAPYTLEVPKGVKVIAIDIAMDLARLPYYAC